MIRESYGKVPIEFIYPPERTKIYYNEIGIKLPEDERIDDITWNDLEMDLIFSRICNCSSFAGEQILYSRLHHLPKEVLLLEVLEKRVNYFENHPVEREELQLLLNRLGKQEVSYYLPMFINNLECLGISNIYIYRLLQILLVLTIVPVLLFQNPIFLVGVGGIFSINVFIYVVNKMKHETYLASLASVVQLIKTGKKILKSNLLPKDASTSSLVDSMKQLDKLSKSIGIFVNKKEAGATGEPLSILRDYLLGGTLWDFTKYNQIIKYLKGRQNAFLEVFDFVGEVDMEISIASFRKSLPYYCQPKFKDKNELDMEEVYHPLVTNAVGNTIQIKGNIIITGSNASGKSTFIKAIVINGILAQSIHTCMAQKMIMPKSKIITSMAVRDNLSAGESYYVKEIKYLNRIIENMEDDRVVICAIDEILRGTNTQERIAASVAVMEHLAYLNCIAVVASHDLELTQILNKQYHNYHFCEQILEGDIVFDYKIREGVSNTKNAIRLMESIGFPKEIIDRALEQISAS